MSGLFRKNENTPEGKYLVQRRDGTIPEWPYFVIGAKDPCAPQALLAYADQAEKYGFDQQYVKDIRDLANEFDIYRWTHEAGDPDAPPYRIDDPEIIKKMRDCRSA